MSRRARHILALSLGLAAALPAVAGAVVTSVPPPTPPGPSPIAPGVSYERQEPAPDQVVHVIRMVPGRPLLQLAPVLTAGSITRRGTLTSAMAARLDTGAVAGMNADYFNLTGGYPSGILLTPAGILAAGPEPSRSSLLIHQGGGLEVLPLLLAGRYQAQDPAATTPFAVRTFNSVNRPPGPSGGVVLYTPEFGDRTPSGSATDAVIAVAGGVPVKPNSPLQGVVVSVASNGGGTAFAPGQVVLSATGASRKAAVAELVPGARVTIEAAVAGITPDTVSGVGGGPLLVRDGIPVTQAGEGFTSSQLDQRTARSAIGQAAGGTIMLVTSEGPQQGRVGYTAAEQAQLMASLGSRTAMGFDSGGSAIMTVGSRLVIPWSAERPISDALVITYGGVQLSAPQPARVSPNGDGVDDTTSSVVRSPVPGSVTVRLHRRSGGTVATFFNGSLGPASATVQVDPSRRRLREGPYRLVAELTPADGSSPTTQSRNLVVDGTLSRLQLRSTTVAAGAGRRKVMNIRFTLKRPARVSVQIQDPATGATLRRLLVGRALPRGPQLVVWDRTVSRRPAVGTFRVVVQARTFLGTTGLQEDVALR